MAREFLATKITSGRGNPSPKATWWFRHYESIVRYLVFSGIQNVKGTEEVRMEALDLADEWDRMRSTSFPKGAMGRHVTLELGLVDAVRRKDSHAVETIGDLLVEDVEKQVDQLVALEPHMPKDRLKRLIEEHVALFTERIRHSIEGTDRTSCDEKAKANAMALVDFTIEWF